MDVAEKSAFLTSIVAAYTGVEKALSRVTSGYRLSLEYHILHIGPRPPTLVDFESPGQRLQNCLRSWRQDASGRAPQFLASLLQNKYTDSAAFDACSLVGKDKLLLSALRPVAEKEHFSLLLASITVTVKTPYLADYSQILGCDESAVWSEGESFYTQGEDSFASTFTSVEDVVITRICDLDGIPVEVDGLVMESCDLLNGSDAILHEADSQSFEACRV